MINKYLMLENVEWLKQKYENERLSTVEIAKIVNCKSPNSVRQALIKFGIKTRNLRDSNVKKSDTFINNISFIDGSLLGDGGLAISNKSSLIAAPYFYKKNKHKDHITWFAKHIDYFPNIKESNRCLNGKIFYHFEFRTLSNESLKSYFARWYPKENNYKKRVPKDIILTKDVVLNWFLDDGSSYSRKSKNKNVIITLSSQSFSKEDNLFLCEKLNKDCLIKSSISPTNSGTGWVIKIYGEEVKKFFEYIGRCPIESLKYKWK